ncbi:uncharacterized protein SPPG_05377 [Spizellomyces punctatus DAOM BR117]|uniref:Smr domain-containing protein n=1 Tax=Spizellomyces punctatus (strain DAOM BR117) TaxID=645134 RepID=A0A0L0HEF5_SPIPD|nr:uncharacterized protein SPPG_05377 [Spizellomyces punctatus DAOM BR117]KNC99118.1 hypothetical protein SPPG_05377 [Spizellomyces punctatus DAOM BR117]|eukprot:XP_016607158.1 hypothetical protein SPPG_05377 [Spizellomyces punctatus DAOM BR117]
MRTAKGKRGQYSAVSNPRKVKLSKPKQTFSDEGSASQIAKDVYPQEPTQVRGRQPVDLASVDGGLLREKLGNSATTVTTYSPASMQFLAEIFPETLKENLEEALLICEGNVEKAVDSLLSDANDLLDDVCSTCSSSELSSNGEISRFDDAASSGSLSSSTSKGTASSSESHCLGRKDNTNANGPELATLSAMFPDHDQRTILSALNTHQFDMDRAADTLLRLTLDEIPDNRVCKEDEVLAALMEIFPEQPLDILRITLRRCGGLDATVQELTKDIKTAWGRKCDGRCSAMGHPCVYHRSEKPIDMEMTADRRLRRADSASMSSRSGPIFTLSARGSSLPVSSRIQNVANDVEQTGGTSSAHANPSEINFLDPGECRQVAQSFREKRDEAFRRAAKAFRKGDLTGKGSAGYFSQEGRDLTEQMMKWNSRAAQATIQRNKARFQGDPFVIDLHGLTVNEAVKYVDEAVNEWYSGNGAHAKPQKPLQIITGSGQHSSHGIRKLYPVIYKRLSAKGWTVRPGGSGWFFVKP